MKKTRILAASLACVLLASITPLTTTAASSFTPNENNFKPVFDFDTIPVKYPDNYAKAGQRSDKIGLDGQKAITGTKIKLSYHLTIKSGIGNKGKALQLDVHDAPADPGAWCPVKFDTTLGDNLKNLDVTTPDNKVPDSFMFWIDTTKFKSTNDAKAKEEKDLSRKGINLYIQEEDVDSSGNQIADHETAWHPKPSEDGGFFYVEDGKGGWKHIDAAPKKDSSIYMPHKYKGWVNIPIKNFIHTDWNKHDADGKFNCKKINQVNFGIGNYDYQNGSQIVIDEIGFMGNYKKATQPTAAPKTEPTKSTKDTTQASDQTTTAAITEETETSGVDESDSSETDESEFIDESDSSTDESGVEADITKPGKKKKGAPWGVIIPIIVVVVLAGGGTGGFFLYKKLKK